MKQRSQQAQVATLCRKYLKSLNIKCSVTSSGYSMGDSVKISISDQPPKMMEKIKAEFNKYQQGHFNGMEDIYEYSNSRDDIPQTKFLFISNSSSSELKQKIWGFLQSINFNSFGKLPTEFTEVDCSGDLYRVHDLMFQISTGYSPLADKFWN